MKRLLYFIDKQIIIIHRDNNCIELVNNYENNQESLEQFEHYLENLVKLPIQLLLDTVDEDFFHESIPHVPAKDRKAIVKRKAERVLRNHHEYYYYQLQGRDKQGKRNDNILLSGLTNPTFLQTVLALLYKHQIPVVGIWSLPIISLRLVSLLKLKQDNLLIVSRQNQNNLRLTFINKNRFSMSRMVTLHGHDLFELIASEINQTIKYLTNKRYLGFDDMMSVCMIVKEKNLAIFKDKLKNSHSIEYLFTSHTAIENLQKIKTSNESYNIAIYSELCFHEKTYQDHYSTIKERKNYLAYVSKKALLIFSFTFLIFSLIISQFYLAEGEQARKKTIHIKQTEHSIIEQYDVELLPLEEQLKQATFKRSSVLLSDKLQQYKSINPLQFYLLLSNAYTQSGLETIHFDKIDWNFDKKVEEQHTTNDENQFNAQQSTQTDSLKYPKTVVIIHGQLPLYDNKYRKATKQMELLVTSIKKQKMVHKVIVNKYPVDLRDDHSVDGKIDMLDSIDSDNLLPFELQIDIDGQLNQQAKTVNASTQNGTRL